eukprot:3900143-Rhodomonas_salina.2
MLCVGLTYDAAWGHRRGCTGLAPFMLAVHADRPRQLRFALTFRLKTLAFRRRLLTLTLRVLPCRLRTLSSVPSVLQFRLTVL